MPVIYTSYTEKFNGLNDKEKELVAMCGVGTFENTRIYSIESRPVLLTKKAIEKYKAQSNVDFSALINKIGYIIRRKRTTQNEPIDNNYTAHKVEILEFEKTHIFMLCGVKCRTENNKVEIYCIERLFLYP